MAFELMDVRDLKLFRDETGALRMTYRGEEKHFYKVIRNFPKTNPGHFISFLDEEGHEIGIIEDPSTLDPASHAVMEAALREVYFVPTIYTIRSVRIEGDASSWEVDTDDGPRSFRVKAREDISTHDIPLILITDTQNKKYRIEDYDELDPDGKAQINDLLPREVVRLGKTYRSMARMQRGGGFGRL
ncbi:MAG: DUF1854 domain-containing protein [Candidatus Latescibacteria bacterium]|nr:DUF1854 domain-containing protein [Candidatus Latescibacterota bacterium]